MHWQDVRSRVRSFFVDEDEFAAILRGAGLAIVIRVLAAAIGYANMVLLARWMGVAEFGYYSFAIAWLTLLAYPSSLGLPGSALLFVARYKIEGDWPKVLGLIRTVSRISFGCGMAVALIGILATLYARAFLEPGYVNPTLLALCGIPVVALSVTTVEAVRGFGWLGLAWLPSQVAQPVCVLVIAAAIVLVFGELSAVWAVAAAILAYVASVLAQRLIMRARLRSHIQVRADTIDLQLWIRAAFSHLWIFAATIIFIQGGVILVGLSHSAKYVAIYNAAGATSSLMALSLQAANALSAPKFAELHVQKRQADLQNLFTAVVRITLWPSLAIAAGLIAFGTPLLLLFGPDFDQGYSVLTILTLGQLTNVVTGPVANLLNMTGHQLVTAKVTVLCAVVYVLMGVVLTPIWGTVGAALALSGTFVFLNVWLGILVVKKLEIYPTIFSSILGRGL